MKVYPKIIVTKTKPGNIGVVSKRDQKIMLEISVVSEVKEIRKSCWKAVTINFCYKESVYTPMFKLLSLSLCWNQLVNHIKDPVTSHEELF